MKRNAILGGVLWVGLAAASRVSLTRSTFIELLFLLAPLVVVPLGLELCVAIMREEELLFPARIVQWLQFPAALCVAASFWPSPGVIAAILVIPWFCVGCMTGLATLGNLMR